MVDPEEGTMTRFQATWATVFIFLVSCSIFLSTAAYAVKDPA